MPCSKCGRPVSPADQWDVDHVIPRWAGGSAGLLNTWPAHARCNRSDGGRRGAQVTNARRTPVKTARIEERPLKW